MDAHKNFAVSTVATAPSPAGSGTSLVVTAGHGVRFPTPPFNVTIWPAGAQPDPGNAEIARCTAIVTDTLTLVRAQEGSNARTVVVGDQIAATVTAKTLTDVETAVGVAKNLVIENDGATPNSKVVISADAITVEDMYFTSVSKTADIAAAGADGLDTGAEAASTWYAVWLIAKQDGTLASLLSASFTAPTMPAGYAKKRRVGAVRNNASSNFYRISQRGDFCTYTDPVRDTSNHLVLAGGTAAAFTTLSGAQRTVPPSSRRGFMLFNTTSTGTVAAVFTRPTGSGVTDGRQSARVQPVNLAENLTANYVDLDSTQQFDYRLSVSTGGLTIEVSGYIDPVL